MKAVRTFIESCSQDFVDPDIPYYELIDGLRAQTEKPLSPNFNFTVGEDIPMKIYLTREIYPVQVDTGEVIQLFHPDEITSYCIFEEPIFPDAHYAYCHAYSLTLHHR